MARNGLSNIIFHGVYWKLIKNFIKVYSSRFMCKVYTVCIVNHIMQTTEGQGQRMENEQVPSKFSKKKHEWKLHFREKKGQFVFNLKKGN